MTAGSRLFLIVGLAAVLTVPSVLGQTAVALESSAHAPRKVYHRVAEASRASVAFDATYYHLDLTLVFGPDRLDGTAEIHGRARGGAIDTLVLDLDSSVAVDAVTALDGAPLPHLHSNHQLAIDIPGIVAEGEALAVVVTYVAPPNTSEAAAFRTGRLANGSPFAWTLSEPYGAREWWPSRDHPSDKADSIRVTLTVPSPLMAASNGLLRTDPIDRDGTITYDWFSRYPIATYLVSFAVGEYALHEQRYVRPPDLAELHGPLELPIVHYQYTGSQHFGDPRPGWGWQHTPDVMRVLESWFGPYPFSEEKYGHAEFTWPGGMEHQTISSMGGNTLGLVTHELAHQWYGDLVTLQTWPHLWLNEGFATYSELLYWEAVNEQFDTDPHGQVLGVLYSRARNAEGTLLLADTTSFYTMFDPLLVYAKGGMVLHMLRGIVGDDVFREILQAYAWDPKLRYGTATTADFQAIAEAVSGRELDAFFRQWVTEGTGYPTYRVEWSAEPDGDEYRLLVDVRQTQSEPLSNVGVFEMPLTLEIRGEGMSTRVTVQNDARTQQYEFQLPVRPTEVVFDPDRSILRHAEVLQTGTGGLVPPKSPVLAYVFPQPATERITIRFSSALLESTVLEVFDISGRLVHGGEARPGESEITMDVRSLAPGVYFVRAVGIANSGRSVVIAR